jgi:hypothetical protein
MDDIQVSKEMLLVASLSNQSIKIEDDDFYSCDGDTEDDESGLPRDIDILFGRGQPLRDHPGNVRMREIIQKCTPNYRKANKTQRTKVIKDTIQDILSNGARFLVPEKGVDHPRSATPAEIQRKMSHGFRDAIEKQNKLDIEIARLFEEDARQHTSSSARTNVLAPARVSFSSSDVSRPPKYQASSKTEPTARVESFSDTSYDLVEQGMAGHIIPSSIHPIMASAVLSPTPEDLHRQHDMTAEELHPNAPLTNFISALRREQRLTRWLVFFLMVAVAAVAALVVLMLVSNKEPSSSPVVDLRTAVPSSPSSAPTAGPKTMLEQIISRGVLRCGITEREGYSRTNDDGHMVGFEADLVSLFHFSKSLVLGLLGLLVQVSK